jgi:hypothetical protein
MRTPGFTGFSHTSDSTQVEAYIAKNELRQLGSAIEGDYRVCRGSLMIDTNHDTYASVTSYLHPAILWLAISRPMLK